MEKEKPKIKIYDPILDVLKLFKEQVLDIRRSFNFIITFIVGVMLIGFVTMLLMTAQIVIDSWQFRSTTSKEFQQLKIQEKNIENTVIQQKLFLEELSSIKEYLIILKETVELQNKIPSGIAE